MTQKLSAHGIMLQWVPLVQHGICKEGENDRERICCVLFFVSYFLSLLSLFSEFDFFTNHSSNLKKLRIFSRKEKGAYHMNGRLGKKFPSHDKIIMQY